MNCAHSHIHSFLHIFSHKQKVSCLLNLHLDNFSVTSQFFPLRPTSLYPPLAQDSHTFSTFFPDCFLTFRGQIQSCHIFSHFCRCGVVHPFTEVYMDKNHDLRLLTVSFIPINKHIIASLQT